MDNETVNEISAIRLFQKRHNYFELLYLVDLMDFSSESAQKPLKIKSCLSIASLILFRLLSIFRALKNSCSLDFLFLFHQGKRKAIDKLPLEVTKISSGLNRESLAIHNSVFIIRYSFLLLCVFCSLKTNAQSFEGGVEYTYGRSYTTFNGNLADIVGFQELEITEADLDTAFATFDLSAPRWVKDLFPGLRLEIDQEIVKQLSRNNNAVRFYGRFLFFGGSFMISEPRLSEQLASKMISNQLKSLRLAMGGRSEELTKHLGDIALAETQQVKPFFPKRYDLELYLHAKKIVFGDHPIYEFGNESTIDAELTTGIRLTADPSPVVELGSVLFISQRIDSLLEGGLLRPVENATDEIAEAIQSTVFGKFKDPRIVSSFGGFVRGEALVNFGQSFSFVTGAEVSLNKHLAVSGIKPMFSIYGFGGLRWRWGGS